MGWLGWLSQRVSLMSVCALVPQVLRVYLWCGESCGETRLGMRSLESGVIAEGTDSISAATCCWHQREGLLFCPRFRHSYIISSRSDLSHIFSFLELAFTSSIWTRSACRSDTTIPSEHAAACCCWPGAPSAVPSDVEQKTQAQPQLKSRAQ